MSQFSPYLSNNPTPNNNLRQTARFFIQDKSNIQEPNTFIKSPKSSVGNVNLLKTSSKIILPAGKYHFNKDRKIRWVRCYSKVV